MLEIKNVCKKYSTKEVLRKVSFTVRKGEIHGLIGENSAGKTTLIKCLTGIYRVDKGEILFDHRPVFDNPGVKENIGYVADYNAYLRGYSIKGIVHLFEVMYPGFSKEKFQELNKSFQLEETSIVQNISKGQRTKLAFMLAVSSNTEYLILDEPTSGLDVMSKRQLFDILLYEVENRNVAVLISSHNLDGLEKICDRITLLKNGEVLVTEDVEDIKQTFVKAQVVFENGAPEEFYARKDILDYSNIGSVYTVVADNSFETLEKELKEQGAIVVEQLAISLEDSFVFATQKPNKS